MMLSSLFVVDDSFVLGGLDGVSLSHDVDEEDANSCWLILVLFSSTLGKLSSSQTGRRF